MHRERSQRDLKILVLGFKRGRLDLAQIREILVELIVLWKRSWKRSLFWLWSRLCLVGWKRELRLSGSGIAFYVRQEVFKKALAAGWDSGECLFGEVTLRLSNLTIRVGEFDDGGFDSKLKLGFGGSVQLFVDRRVVAIKLDVGPSAIRVAFESDEL